MIGWAAVLDFEASAPRDPARKTSRIRERFGVSPTAYRSALMAALDHPRAAGYAPELVARLVRIRDDRRARRWAGPAVETAPLGPAPAPVRRQRVIDLDGRVAALEAEQAEEVWDPWGRD